MHSPQQLTSFSLLCNSGCLFRLLRVMNSGGGRMSDLERLRIGNRSWVTLNETDFALLLYFLAVWTTHRVVLRQLPAAAHEELQSKALTDPFDWRTAAFPLAAIAALYLVSLIEAATRFPTGYDGLQHYCNSPYSY